MKCICTGGCWFIGICIMQLITVAIRQTFDIMGLQWSCIVANFCQIAALVIALFGVCRQKRQFIAVYCIWIMFWMGWNTLIICVYLGVIHLENTMMILNLDLSETLTWFKTHTYDCSANVISDDVFDDKLCILDYRNIEIFQSSLQLLLAVIGFSVACYQMGIMKEEENFHFDYVNGSAKKKTVDIPMHELQPLA